MMKIYCNVCDKYWKFKSSTVLYTFQKTLRLSIVYSKCGHQYENLFK